MSCAFSATSHTRRALIPSASASGAEMLKLRREISSLEKELKGVEYKIRMLESEIQTRYTTEIQRIRELGAIYKKQKTDKRTIRADQRKRGKNHHASVGRDTTNRPAPDPITPHATEKAERNRLYRQAIMQVHPDKFINHSDALGRHMENLTIELIDTYQNGDMKKLRHLHRHIVSGNALVINPDDGTTMPDSPLMLTRLTEKKNELLTALNGAKQSRLYEALAANDTTQSFLDSLGSQFALRIRQLERRTRQKRRTMA